jgi:hypothetical protein
MDEQSKPTADESVFDNEEELSGLIHGAFVSAAKAAVAENDRLGLVTHGATDGKLTLCPTK